MPRLPPVNTAIVESFLYRAVKFNFYIQLRFRKFLFNSQTRLKHNPMVLSSMFEIVANQMQATSHLNSFQLFGQLVLKRVN
jgi:hypothetical protein